MSTTAITTADILMDVIRPTEPTFATQFAQQVMSLQLSDDVTQHIRELLQRNNAGSITAEDKTLLDKYLLVGQFIDLMQAKAQVTLRTAAVNPQ